MNKLEHVRVGGPCTVSPKQNMFDHVRGGGHCTWGVQGHDAGGGVPCVLRSNASWLMVTGDPPVGGGLKTLPSHSFVGGR